MKQSIWKYPLQPAEAKDGHLGQMVFEIEMPQRSEVLTVQVQNNVPTLWAVVWTELPKLKRRIEVYGTGHECESMGRKYISTFQLNEGRLVFHAFEAP